MTNSRYKVFASTKPRSKNKEREWMGLWALAFFAFLATVGYIAIENRGTPIGEVFVQTVKQSVPLSLPSGEGGKSEVRKVRSRIDNKHYYVAPSLPSPEKAADLFAEMSRRAQTLLQTIDERLDGGRRIQSGDGKDITDNMRKMVERHFNKVIPFAEYHNPHDLTVGSNRDKGDLIEVCLRSKYDPSEWNAINTLFRVLTHELAHSADFEVRGDGQIAHGPQFKRLHMYLLNIAETLNLYSCEEYTKSNGYYCGLKINESYCG